jgi:hypothetical protein
MIMTRNRNMKIPKTMTAIKLAGEAAAGSAGIFPEGALTVPEGLLRMTKRLAKIERAIRTRAARAVRLIRGLERREKAKYKIRAVKGTGNI